MGLLDMLNSFANGTLIDDTFNAVDKSLEALENLPELLAGTIDEGEKVAEKAMKTFDTGAEKITHNVDKVVKISDVIGHTLDKK